MKTLISVLAITGLAILLGYFYSLQIALIFVFSTLIILFVLFYFFGVFTMVSTGTKKYKVHGEEYVAVMKADAKRFWLWKFFGLHFVGFSFMNMGVKGFWVEATKANPNLKPKKEGEPVDPTEWVINNHLETGGKKWVDFLLDFITRTVITDGAEIGGKQPLGVTAAFTIVFETINGAVFIFRYKAEFTNPVGLILGKINAKIATFKKYDSLVQAGSNYMDFLLTDTDLQAGLAKYGLRLTEIKMVNLATDQAIEMAARKKLIAELEAAGIKVTADAEAYVITTKGDAEAGVISSKETAKVQTVLNLLKTAFPSASEEELLAKATDLLGKKALAEMPNLQTLVTDLLRK